jgi:hypothetical protein
MGEVARQGGPAMSHLPVVPQSDFQRQLVERALALAVELERAAASAPHGSLLDRCEALLLDQGRQLLRDALTGALQQQIAQAEKRGPQPAPVPADRTADTKAPTRATS